MFKQLLKQMFKVIHQADRKWIGSFPRQISYTKTKFSKNEVASNKTPVFVISDPFCTFNSISLNFSFWQGSFSWKCCVFSPIGLQTQLSSKKQCSSFTKKISVFQKTCFKVEILKTSKNSSDCCIKICRSLKRKAILKIRRNDFLRNLCSFCWL